VPLFVDRHFLRQVVWAIAEVLLPPLIERLDNIMGLVQIDDAILQDVASTLVTIDSEVGTLISNSTLPADNASVQAIQNSLTDLQSKLSAAGVNPPAAGDGTDSGDGTPAPTA